MYSESVFGLIALVLWALAIVARVGSVKLTAADRRHLHLLEQRKVALAKTLLALRGERELLDRNQARASLDRSAACEDVALLRGQLEELRQGTQRRNDRIARRITTQHHLCPQQIEAAA